ncbi:unnamed protein product [Moneuplotes crassus]|uniref:Uncharacterized protein n=1 Tax=Euplotes crassus TaxID=5936 RepID=A0AAD1XS24_EUPCR|nr:unnamed protein product [Moneuplotes crassus]
MDSIRSEDLQHCRMIPGIIIRQCEDYVQEKEFITMNHSYLLQKHNKLRLLRPVTLHIADSYDSSWELIKDLSWSSFPFFNKRASISIEDLMNTKANKSIKIHILSQLSLATVFDVSISSIPSHLLPCLAKPLCCFTGSLFLSSMKLSQKKLFSLLLSTSSCKEIELRNVSLECDRIVRTPRRVTRVCKFRFTSIPSLTNPPKHLSALLHNLSGCFTLKPTTKLIFKGYCIPLRVLTELKEVNKINYVRVEVHQRYKQYNL